MLLYYVITNIVLFFVSETWNHNEYYKPLDHINPEIYSINIELLSLATKLISTDTTIQGNMDAYV